MIKTSEYVSLGHPDKIADYISEYILDRLIEKDPTTRYALEVQIKDNIVTLGGEITTSAKMHINKWVKEAVKKIGYTKEYAEAWGAENTLNGDDLHIHSHISQQSPDIAQGVNTDAWGDQGIFFGMYSSLSPDGDGLDHYLAKALGRSLYETAKITFAVGDNKNPPFLFGLDIKTQVTVEYCGGVRVKKVIVAIPDAIGTEWSKECVKTLVDDFLNTVKIEKSNDYQLIVNGTGSYKKHASVGDCGTTGRKLAVDFYGSNCLIGGGSPWTKDGTKADLSLNILAYEIAKSHFLITSKNGVHLSCVRVEISCCIGRPEIDVIVKKYNGYEDTPFAIDEYTVDMKPSTLIERYKLNKPVFAEMCEKGLFINVE